VAANFMLRGNTKYQIFILKINEIITKFELIINDFGPLGGFLPHERLTGEDGED